MMKHMALAMALTLGALSGLSAVAADAKVKIAVIPKSTGGEFWETVGKGAKQAAADQNVDIQWVGTVDEKDLVGQNKIIENMINLQVKGIVLAPLNKSAMRKEVESAVGAGIPVVIFDSAVDGTAQSSFVATDSTAAGAMGGKHLLELLAGKKEARVMCMRFVQGTGSTEARAAGFIAAAKAGGATVVADPYANNGTAEDCKKVAANTLEKLVKDGKLELDGIFACNLYSTLGVVSALADLEKQGVKVKVKFVGFDTSKKLVEDVQAGRVDALVAQDPYKMGYLAVETMVKVIKGEKVAAVVDTGAVLVTKAALEKDAAVRKLVGLE